VGARWPLTDHSVVDIPISIDLECECVACGGLFGAKSVGESGQRKGWRWKEAHLFPSEFERVLCAVTFRVAAAVSKVELRLWLPPFALTVRRDLGELDGEGGRRLLLLLLDARRFILRVSCSFVQRRRQSIHSPSVCRTCVSAWAVRARTGTERTRRTTRRALPSWIVLMQVTLDALQLQSRLACAISLTLLDLEARVRPAVASP
jgi:hypothetical protein